MWFKFPLNVLPKKQNFKKNRVWIVKCRVWVLFSFYNFQDCFTNFSLSKSQARRSLSLSNLLALSSFGAVKHEGNVFLLLSLHCWMALQLPHCTVVLGSPLVIGFRGDHTFLSTTVGLGTGFSVMVFDLGSLNLLLWLRAVVDLA